MIAITGTPGTGKTTVAEALRKEGFSVVDLNRHIKDNDLLEGFDDARDTYDVDLSKIDMPNGNDDFVEGHLSHFLDCDMIIVLRCNPSVLHERLSRRGYSSEKILENVQAEALDVILCESVDSGKEVHEIDCTSAGTNMILTAIKDILAGSSEYPPGNVNWGEEMVKWF